MFLTIVSFLASIILGFAALTLGLHLVGNMLGDGNSTWKDAATVAGCMIVVSFIGHLLVWAMGGGELAVRLIVWLINLALIAQVFECGLGRAFFINIGATVVMVGVIIVLLELGLVPMLTSVR